MAILTTDLVREVLNNMELDGNKASNIVRWKVYDNLSSIQRYLIRNLPLKEIDVAVKTTKFDLADGTNRIQWPDDWARFIRLMINYSAAITESVPGRLVREDKTGAMNNIDVTDYAPSQDYPQFERIENGFRFLPVPSAARANGGQLKYVQMPPNISSTQNSILRDDHRNLLVYGGTELCAAVDLF